jgi:prepilin-type N-terminal cleavage/methylation domain-containing protein
MKNGFSLLETVVALTIVGLTSVAALAAFGTELRASGQTSRALDAVALAESRLAALRMLPRQELEPLPDSIRGGRFPEPFEAYQWEASSHHVREEEDLFQVGVVVRWDGGSYSLATRLYRPQPVTTR